MSEAIKASKNRPARFSEPSRVFTSHVQNIKEDVVRVKAQHCSTFPTDQVPQPVPRDTIVLTRMAAPTDFRGAACLPQSAPTVQAQVNSTGCVITCDDCTQATFYQYQRGPMCPVDPRGDRAGPLVALQPLSVIPSSSCPASARPLLTSNQIDSMSSLTPLTTFKTLLNPIFSITATSSFVSVYSFSVTSSKSNQQSFSDIPINPVILFGGSSILKSNNKMQSVNVNCSLAVNKYKGNKNNFSSETAVTEPNTTEPQRNIIVEAAEVDVTSTGIDNVVTQPNNNSYNSVKLLELVNVKNVNNNGALNLFPNDDDQYKANQLYIPDIDIPVVLLLPIVQGNKYSNYYPPKCSFKNNTKKLFEIDEYASNFAESESKSGIHQQHTITSNDIQSNTCENHNDFIYMTTKHTINTTMSINNAINNNLIKNTNTNVVASFKAAKHRHHDQYYTFSQLIEQQNEAQTREKQWIRLHGNGRRLRLCGGGESSLNTGTSGWGTPPATNSNNNNANNSTGWGSTPAAQNPNNQNNWNNNSTRNNTTGPGQGPPNSQDSSNTNKTGNSNANPSQNANPNQPPTSNTAGNQGWNQNNANKTSTNAGPNPTGPSNPTNTVAPTTTSTKQQLEQLNSMREALFSQDGWGGQHVNQDTNWDIPSSPEPGQKEGPGGAPIWKPPVNNGTELWEANLRNGGQPPAQPVQKTPWGHTPTTNIGGTWGEEDDVSDSSNVWTGVPNNPQQWGAQGQNNSNAMWGGPKKENDWGNNGTGNNSGWGDPRADPRAAAMDPREAAMRPTSIDPRNSGTGAADPRESMRMIGGDPMRDGMRDPRDLRGIPDMRGDPRGISGRLNGEGMWGAPPHPPHQMSHHQPPGKMVGPAPNGVNQWSGPPPKEIGMTNKQSGWEEPSPPSQRRTMPNFDDGTSLWGNPTQQPNRMPASGKLSHWTDLPSGGPMGNRGGNACPPGMVGSNRKPPTDGSLWGRNGSWGDDAQQHWSEEAWNTKPKAPPVAWDSEIDWNKPGPKLTKEHVWNSKQFRHLVEMGYKKEDAENALRLRDMNLDDALDILSPLRPSVDTWRNSTGGSASAVGGRHDEHGYDHANAGPYGQRFGPGGPGQIQFPPGGNAPNLINNMSGSGGNPSIPSINNMSPAVVQKILQASGGANAGSAAVTNIPGYGATGSQARSQPPPAQSQPSTQQLRMLVQQIQMAVQAGYLNHQILNQPLAPQTLILLNQLLQHIKLLQSLMNQHSVFQSQSSLGKPNSQAILQVTVNITKTKQQITNLQNQIAANQALYVKQMGGGGGGAGQDFFKTNMHDPISALQGNFSDLSLNKEPPTSYAQSSQSRLQQWIKPEKEDTTGEFSRAPGSIAKPPVAHSSPSMNLGLGQSDGPWSTGRSNDTGGWPDSGTDGPDGAGKDAWPSAQASPATFLDVVPEFEPGKPWKMKSIEDDPTITPGSVVRSPLSLATIKDTEIFSAQPPSTVPSKASPPVEPLSISSSTWSFNPISTTSFTSPLNKIGATKGTWGDITPQPTANANELWGAPAMGKRGPPPGLVKGGIGGSNATTNGWSGIGGARSAASGAWGSANWGSSWLLLRNLTAQIDGSTLQTLCKQHGPLQSFHLYSNHGFALAKYSSREEAIKAQTALNNCVLGNTTILAESPGDSDVNTLMQNLAQQSGSSGAGWRGGGGGTKGAPGANLNAGTDTWGNACWPPNPTPTASLWGAPPSTMDSDTQRATPSSLNSYLPGDLLGEKYTKNVKFTKSSFSRSIR
ncbi:protein Gawky isoform X2 [Chrysoperla carnea]|uniref:protein Gawky isoform X2 n=1 Tax=Chrysoperla carnea TaxID=189513 RepID=UPI001D08BF68|nr:protein Gawky isoform X2 [Chrysoperla carnea]